MTDPRTDIAAAILAGGEASRLGGLPKGLLALPGGTSIIRREVEELTAAGLREIAIFANDPAPYRSLGLPILPDHRLGLGPLGGVESALRHYADRCRAVLLLPCDLPGITRSEISLLTAAFAESDAPIVFAQTGPSFWHPLCAVVSCDLQPAVTRAVEQGWRRVGTLWRFLGAVPVHFPDPGPFSNINTPEDWRRWLMEAEQRQAAPLSARPAERSAAAAGAIAPSAGPPSGAARAAPPR